MVHVALIMVTYIRKFKVTTDHKKDHEIFHTSHGYTAGPQFKSV